MEFLEFRSHFSDSRVPTFAVFRKCPRQGSSFEAAWLRHQIWLSLTLAGRKRLTRFTAYGARFCVTFRNLASALALDCRIFRDEAVAPAAVVIVSRLTSILLFLYRRNKTKHLCYRWCFLRSGNVIWFLAVPTNSGSLHNRDIVTIRVLPKISTGCDRYD